VQVQNWWSATFAALSLLPQPAMYTHMCMHVFECFKC
jgi:hypothetical protein